MRPSDITDGIAAGAAGDEARLQRFNEAVGYYRRNPRPCQLAAELPRVGFNEAVGYYRRNPVSRCCTLVVRIVGLQ